MASVTRRGARRRPMSEINVVPYIDVMLVMLVIFMITAPLLSTGVDVELPLASSAPIESQEQEPLIVSVDAAGRIYLNVGGEPDQALDTETLLARVAAVQRQNPGGRVLIRGDRAVDYGRVVEIMAQLKAAGVSSVGLVTQPPESP